MGSAGEDTGARGGGRSGGGGEGFCVEGEVVGAMMPVLVGDCSYRVLLCFAYGGGGLRWRILLRDLQIAYLHTRASSYTGKPPLSACQASTSTFCRLLSAFALANLTCHRAIAKAVRFSRQQSRGGCFSIRPRFLALPCAIRRTCTCI